MWSELRNRQLGGFKFVRQMPVGPYFGDFVCRSRRVIVEVDGATHAEDHEIAADATRETYLVGLGYRVYRVTNDDISTNIDGVLDELLALLEGRADLDSLSSSFTGRGC